MRDNDFIKKYGLTEAVKRFGQINEYTFITSPVIDEDGEGEDEQNPNPQDGGMSQPQDNGGGNGMMPQGDDMQGQQPPMGSNNNAPEPMPQGGQGGMGGDNTTDMPQPQGGEPMGGDEEDVEDIDMDVDDEHEDDEVIDVDDLTNSQEATEYKVDSVSDKLTSLLKVVMNYQSEVEKSNQKIEDLKAEIVRRNPTPEEQLNIRSQASYPYSELPRDYWEDKKKQNPMYNVISDNEVSPNKEQEKYEIRNSDINSFDANSIADSFDEPLKLSKFFNF